MKTKLISLAIAAAVATPFAAQAGSLKVPNQDITLSGGITGAYVYNSDTERDAFAVPDALIDLATEAKPGGMAFDLGVGALSSNTLTSSGLGNSLASSGAPLATGAGNVGVQYGWVSVLPTDGLKIDAGILATNVGYEVVPSYSNDNILRGLVWNNQPAYYTGARATYSTGRMSFYAEANKNAGTGSAIGANGSFGGVNAALNVFSTVNVKSIVDIILSGKVGSVKLAANLDYQTKAEAAKTTGTDDNAYGIALYASMPMGDKASLPVRIEYVNDGTSGLYGLSAVDSLGNPVSNTAMTFTITPTYNFSDSTFVRAELAYVSTDKKIVAYQDDKGANTDSNLIVGLQGGVRF